MTSYHFKVEVIWVRKAISYQSNKAYSVTTASLFILQMVRIEFDSLFRSLSLHWFLSHWLIWWFTRFTPFPFTIITPSIWYWVPLLLLVFLILDNEGPESGEHDSNSPAPYFVQDYIYEQLLGSQENTQRKNTCTYLRLLCVHCRKLSSSRVLIIRKVTIVFKKFDLSSFIRNQISLRD